MIALTVIGTLHVVIYRRLTAAPRLSRRLRIGVAAALAVLALLFVGSWTSLWAPLLSPDAARPLAWIGMIWLAFGLYLVLGLLVVAVLSVIARLARRPARDRVLLNRVGAVLALVVAAATTTWGIFEAADPDVTSFEVTAGDLPAEFDGTTVVVLSDLHIGAVNSQHAAQRAVDLANAAEPDIVVLAGDLVEGSAARYGYQLAPLADLQADLGVYAVTGNHEFISGEPEAWIQRWQQLGITVLQNEAVTVERNGASLTIAGVHDAAGTGSMRTDPQAALAGVEADEFVLYLAHQPIQAEQAQGMGIDLQLSGHTHGGQLWPMHYAVLASQPMLDGRADVGDVPVLTSRGAAAWGPPVRVGAPPEVPVVTLRAG